MNKLLHLLPVTLLLATSPLQAEPTEAPAAPAAPTPVVTSAPKPAPVRVAPAAAPASSTTPAPATAATRPVATAPAGNAAVAAPAPTTVGAAAGLATPAAPVAPAVTLEQRRQQEMLANAERVDKANRELLARNQELQLQLENLSIQNNVLKRDRNNDGIWKGAGAVIVGFLMGWFFSGAGRRKSSW